MAMFGFKARFVNPVRLGLGLPEIMPPEFQSPFPARFPPALGKKKRHTIRAERKDGKRPAIGEELHLFYALRTKQCMRIVPRQVAFCTAVSDIGLSFGDADPEEYDGVITPGTQGIAQWGYASLDAFAVGDGFANWQELRAFWRVEHPGVDEFKGFITFWEGRKSDD